MVTIITDSSSDLLKDFQEKHNIRVLPMPINFGEESYLSGVDLSNEEFYDKLDKSEVLPTTSMINSYTFKEAFEEELKKGGEIVAITISSELSVTFEQALEASKEVNAEKIFVVDSLNASFGQAALVMEGIKLRDKGKSAKEIYDLLNEYKSKIRLTAMVNTLKYLKAGGRLKSSAAFIGTVLNVKPLISLEEGKVVSKAKAIGKANAFKTIVSQLKNASIDEEKSIFIAHANDMKAKEEFEQAIKKAMDINISEVIHIGSTIGVHIGPGAVGIAYFVK